MASAPIPQAFAGSAIDVFVDTDVSSDGGISSDGGLEVTFFRLRHSSGRIICATFDEVEADRLLCGYRIAALAESQFLAVIRRASLRALDAMYDLPANAPPDDADVAERVSLEVIGDLFELMGRARPNLIG